MEVKAGEQGEGERVIMLDVVITIAEFKNQLKARGYAESTVLWYGLSLDMFKRYLCEGCA